MTFKWATVTSVTPLYVRLDGDTDPLPFTPDTLVNPAVLNITDRVRCELANRKVIIHGVAGGV